MNRRVRSFVACLLFVLGLVASPSASAASIVARSVAYMAEHASAVVRGVVVASDVSVDATGQVWTRHTIAVSKAYKGEVGASVQVWQHGGQRPDGVVVEVNGDFRVHQGDDAVWFLAAGDASTGDADRMYAFLLGWSVFDVASDGRVRRNQDHLGVWVSDGDTLRPATPDEVVAPSTLAELDAQILRALESR